MYNRFINSFKATFVLNNIIHFFLSLILLTLLFCANKVDAENKIISEIKIVNNVSELNDILDKSDKKHLIIWDVDKVLIVAIDRIFHPENIRNELPKKHAEAAISKYSVSKKQAKLLGSKILLQRKIRLVEEELVTIIKKLQNNNIKTIALTKLYTGTYGAIENMEDWRIEQLARFNIAFNKAFNDEFLILNDLQAPGKHNPIFKHGILFTNEYTKGEVLGSFLDKINWCPDKIIFIDDLNKNLMSVKAELQKRNISFLGILYTAAERSPSKIDKNVVNMQYNHLVKHEVWLSDIEAKMLINQISR
jgi:hypothetical protein